MDVASHNAVGFGRIPITLINIDGYYDGEQDMLFVMAGMTLLMLPTHLVDFHLQLTLDNVRVPRYHHTALPCTEGWYALWDSR